MVSVCIQQAALTSLLALTQTLQLMTDVLYFAFFLSFFFSFFSFSIQLAFFYFLSLSLTSYLIFCTLQHLQSNVNANLLSITSCCSHSFLSCEDEWWLKWDSIRQSMKGSPLMKGSQKKIQKRKKKKNPKPQQQHIKQHNLTPSKNTKNRRWHHKEVRQSEAFNK